MCKTSTPKQQSPKLHKVKTDSIERRETNPQLNSEPVMFFSR